jgi:hypothetical protein
MTGGAGGVLLDGLGDDVGVGEVDVGVDEDLAVEVVVADQGAGEGGGAAAVRVGDGGAVAAPQPGVGEQAGAGAGAGPGGLLPGARGAAVAEAPDGGDVRIREGVVGGDDLAEREVAADDVLDEAQRRLHDGSVEGVRVGAGDRRLGEETGGRQGEVDEREEGVVVDVADGRAELGGGEVGVDDARQGGWIGLDGGELGLAGPHAAQRHRDAEEVLGRGEQLEARAAGVVGVGGVGVGVGVGVGGVGAGGAGCVAGCAVVAAGAEQEGEGEGEASVVALVGHGAPRGQRRGLTVACLGYFLVGQVVARGARRGDLGTMRGAAHQAASTKRGMVAVKVEPTPTWLSTVKLPPMSSQRRREMVRPRPVPP